MQAIISIRPFLAVLASVFATALILLSWKRPNIREFWSVLAGVIKFGIVISMAPLIFSGHTIEYTLVTFYQGIDIKFRVDPLGLTFATISSFLWIFTTFYSIGYMRSTKEHAQTRYFACFAISLSAAVGIAFSANLITLFVFYEFLSIATVPLVGHKETPEAVAGARKYFLYLFSTSKTLLLTGIFIIYAVTGSTDFNAHGLLKGTPESTLLFVAFFCFLFGFAKGAVMPVHSWLPAAMVAPTPVSALLHAVAVVKTGVFVLLKVILFVFGVDLLSKLGVGTALAYFASFTIIVASFIALRQDNLKLRLAYSTISQLSYVVLAVAILTPGGITASIMHIIIHAFGKITLFFAAGAIYVATRKTNISELNGIGKQMPLTMAAFTIGVLSMIGVPPAAGFISKWYMISGSIEARQIPFIIVIAASTILNACYFLPIVYTAYFKRHDNEIYNEEWRMLNKGYGMINMNSEVRIKEAPPLMVVSLILTAIGTLVLFFWPSLFLELARMVVGVVI